MTDLTYSPAAVSRLLNAVRHPETVEGYVRPADRLDEIAAAFVTADRETRDALIEEAAELLTLAEADDHEWQAPSIKDQLDSAGFGHSGQF